jgi:hypothetical protein
MRVLLKWRKFTMKAKKPKFRTSISMLVKLTSSSSFFATIATANFTSNREFVIKARRKWL